MGGDCLWTGCVPSKALLAVGEGRAPHAHRRRLRHRGRSNPSSTGTKVWKRIRAVQQDQIASTDDNPDRFREMGIDIVHGHARLTGAEHRDGRGRRPHDLETRYVLLCTGSRPVEPPIAGLTEAGFVTSENLFELDDPPARFVNIGGGPIAVEMVQGFTPSRHSRHAAPEGAAHPAARRAGARRPARRQAAQARVSTCASMSRPSRVAVENGKKVVYGHRGRHAGAGGRPTSCSSRSDARPTSKTSASRISASRRRRRASSSTTGAAPASTRSTCAAISPAGTCSRTRPRTRASARCATCSSPARARSWRACRGARSPIPSSRTPG